MDYKQVPFFVKWLHTLDRFMTWCIINIRLYLRICYKVYTKRNTKLFRRLARWNQSSISPTLFFLFHVIMMVMLPLTRDIPTNIDMDYKQQLLAINVHTASVASEILEYIIGTILFALLLTKVLSLRGKRTFWVTWRILCYASAWFWPIFLAATIYDNLGYNILQTGPLQLLSDIVQCNLDRYIIICTLTALMFWSIVKYKWIKFILCHLNFNNQPKKQYVVKFIGCFLLIGYGLPFLIMFLQSEKIIVNTFYEKKYDYAIKHKDDIKICFYGDRLLYLNYLPKEAIYHIFLTNSIVKLQQWDAHEFKKYYSLALEGKYPELEMVLFYDLSTNPRANRFISSESLKKIKASLTDDQTDNMDNTLMLDQSFWLLKQLRLTPYDESFIFKQLMYIIGYISYKD